MITTPAPDPLMLRYYELSDTHYIENMPEFVLGWNELARDFEINARPAMAAICRSRGEFYGRETGTEFVRVFEGAHLVELIEVA